MQAISRTQFRNYVSATISHVKESLTEDWQKHDWQKKQSTESIAENTKFLDKFEAIQGDSVADVRKNAESKKNKILLGFGLTAALGAIAVAGPLILGVAAGAAGTALGLTAIAGGVVGGQHFSSKEDHFLGKLDSFENDIHSGVKPSIRSGNYQAPPQSSEPNGFILRDDGMLSHDIGAGYEMDMSGKVTLSSLHARRL